MSDTASTLVNAFEPVMRSLFVLAGVGMGIGAVVFVLRAGWYVLRDFVAPGPAPSDQWYREFNDDARNGWN